MRISDWSSDVCSSDLHQDQARRDEPHSLRRAHACRVENDAREMIVIAVEVMAPRELNEPDLLWVQRRTQRIIFLDAVDTQRMARIEFLHFRCDRQRSEEHTSELQSLMRIPYAVFCLKKKKT